MKSGTRNCQNCKQTFVIEPDDFGFYEKMQVPPPTWCSKCRYQRRMSWRNAWHLFKKTDERTKQKIFSIFPDESPVKIYEREYWNSDAWDPMDYGKDYDWSHPFFEQFKKLFHNVPLPAHSMRNLVNCQYCTNIADAKNCYFVRAATFTEDSAYLIWDHASKQCMDSHMTDRCELSYGNLNVARSFKTLFSVDSEDCNEVILSQDCIGCTNCFGCIGLRNKSYYFLNEKYTKEEYTANVKALHLGSEKGLNGAREKAYAFWKTFPHKYIHGRQNVGSTGDYVYESKNAKECFRVRDAEDVKFCQNILAGPMKDCYDYSNWGENIELLYECLICGGGCSNLRFCAQCYPNNKNLEYCVFCQNSSDLFGCVGLKNKQYCIFNKQYTKESFGELRTKIIQHMRDVPYRDRVGNTFGYGEFFPPELSAFSYEITEAYEFFPLSESEAEEKGLVWYPIKKDEYRATLAAKDISDHIKDVQDSVLQEIIGCSHNGECKQECTRAFRVIKEELEFCRRLGIPLPRLCPNCRHYERLKFRNPPKFFKRSCECMGKKSKNEIYPNTVSHFHGETNCPNEFETSYGLEREEIVYCEPCYNSEVS